MSISQLKESFAKTCLIKAKAKDFLKKLKKRNPNKGYELEEIEHLISIGWEDIYKIEEYLNV